MLLLLPLNGLLGLRDTLRVTFLGLGDPEDDDVDLPRLPGGGPRPLLGEIDLERDRPGLRIGERLRLRSGDLLGGGLRGRLGGERRLGGGGERLLTGLPRILLGGEPLGGGDLRLGGGEGERPRAGDAALLRGGVSPRRRGGGDSTRRRGGESSGRLGEPPLRPIGDLLAGFRRGGEGSLGRFDGPSFSALALSAFGVSFFGATAGAFRGGGGGGEAFCR